MFTDEKTMVSKIDRRVYQSLDVVKLIMSIIIVIRHIFQAYIPVESTLYYVVADTISPIGVPTFFVISGFLFFENGGNIKKQCLRLIQLYAIYSLIYFPFSMKNLLNAGYRSYQLIFRYIQESLFKGSYYHLWYVPALIVGICICHFLNHRIKNRKLESVIVIILFIIGLIGRDYYNFIPGASAMVMAYNKVFLTFCNGIFWGTPMVWAGKLIANNSIKKISLWPLPIMVIVLFFESWIVRMYTPDSINSNLLFADLIAIFIVVYIINFDFDSRNIRKYSSILYFVHPLMLWVIPFISSRINIDMVSINILAVFVGALLLSWLILVLSKKIKLLKLLY